MTQDKGEVLGLRIHGGVLEVGAPEMLARVGGRLTPSVVSVPGDVCGIEHGRVGLGLSGRRAGGDRCEEQQ